jgi:hypothetical protein
MNKITATENSAQLAAAAIAALVLRDYQQDMDAAPEEQP